MAEKVNLKCPMGHRLEKNGSIILKISDGKKFLVEQYKCPDCFKKYMYTSLFSKGKKVLTTTGDTIVNLYGDGQAIWMDDKKKKSWFRCL